MYNSLDVRVCQCMDSCDSVLDVRNLVKITAIEM